MRNRIALIVLSVFMLLLTAPIFSASENGSVNYFAPMMEDEYYASLLEYVFNGGALEGVPDLYFALENHLVLADYDEWMKAASLGRAALICGRYAQQCGDEGTAIDYMEMADGHIAAAKELGAPESATGVLEALSLSFWYLIDGSLSKGMKFPGMVDKLYKAHPEDFHVLLLEADRYLHSPGIVGGNKKKGLALFQEAEMIMDRDGAAIWDRFSIYSGLAYGYDKAKDKEKAADYALKAYSIYTADETVNELVEKYS